MIEMCEYTTAESETRADTWNFLGNLKKTSFKVGIISDQPVLFTIQYRDSHDIYVISIIIIFFTVAQILCRWLKKNNSQTKFKKMFEFHFS